MGKVIGVMSAPDRRQVLKDDEIIQPGDRYFFQGAPDQDMPAIRVDIGKTPAYVNEKRLSFGEWGTLKMIFFRDLTTFEPKKR